MGSTRKKLTALKVSQTTEAGKYYDDHGLYLRIEATGSKRWVQRLTICGKQRELGLGSASLVSLAKARADAIENRKVARSGGDPIAAKARLADIPTFEAAARTVHRLHAPTWSNPKHAAQFISTLETYVFPRLGPKRVSDISTADVLAVLTPIWTSKAETARRVRQRIGTVMKWGVAQGYRLDDPAMAIQQALPKQQAQTQHRKSMPYTEVAACIDVIRGSGAGVPTKLAVEFLILTATRSGEVREAVWSEVDLVNRVWVVPAKRMKMKAEHRVPLSDRALEIIRHAQAVADGGDLVFPGTKAGRPLSDMTLSKLVKELGFDVDVHGFRTSFRTWVQEQTNMPAEVAEAALAHKNSNKVEAAYARSDLFEKRRKLMAAWDSYIAVRRGEVVKLGGVAK